MKMEYNESIKKLEAEINDPLVIENGEWVSEAVETSETLENWIESSRNWNERTPVRRGTIAGFPALAWERVQAVRGQPRRAVTVIDVGERRIVLDEHADDIKFVEAE
jgi:hypothetical protein